MLFYNIMCYILQNLKVWNRVVSYLYKYFSNLRVLCKFVNFSHFLVFKYWQTYVCIFETIILYTVVNNFKNLYENNKYFLKMSSLKSG